MSVLNKAERTLGKVRENAMHWAMQTSTIGEDAMAILARAQLCEEWVWPASVDRSPEGQDAQRLDAKHESAVAKPDAQTPPKETSHD
jgi:hypothetical protein